MKSIIVQGLEVGIKDGYYSLTDITKKLSNRHTSNVIRDWLNKISTVKYLEAWEEYHNSNWAQMQPIKVSELGNAKGLTVNRYTELGGIGVFASPGRYGGTYAHIEIALEFTTWLSPKFKVLFFNEWVQMKENEFKNNGIEWTLTKMISNSMENVILAESTLKQVRGEDQENTT